MKTRISLFCSFIAFILIGNCSNASGSVSCRNNCDQTQSLCYLAVLGTTTPTANLLACETIKYDCVSRCGNSSSTSSNSKSSGTSRSSSSGGSRTSSSGGSKSSGSSSSSGGGSSSGGSSGSSHSIVGDTDN